MLANRDRSFPVTGKTVEIKNVSSVIEYSLAKAKNILPQADILLKGQLYSPWYSWDTYLAIRPIKLKNQSDTVNIYFLPGWRRRYFWDGSVNALIDFNVYAYKDGSNKHFILKKAVLGNVKLDFADPLDRSGRPEDFPFLLGYAHISDKKYRVYAVLDNNPNKTIFYNEIFLNLLQKFQFLDEQDEVVMELEKNTYAVYDTAEEPARENFKYAAALFAAFRHSTMILNNLKDSWSPPMFYRYVYPESQI